MNEASRWKVNFESQNGIHLIDECLSRLIKASFDDLSIDGIQEYRRLQKLLELIKLHLISLDCELYPNTQWGNFTSWLTEVRNQTDAFCSNKNVAHLQQANAYIDQIVSVFRLIDKRLLLSIGGKESLPESAFTTAVIAEIERVRNQASIAMNDFNRLSISMEDLKRKISENDEVILAQKNRLDQSIHDFQRQFSEAQELRSTAHAELVKQNEITFQSEIKRLQLDAENRANADNQQRQRELTALQSDGEEHLAHLRRRHREVDEIFGAIGTSALAANFKETADNESKSANLFRWIALGCMLGMAIIAGFAFYLTIGHEVDWRAFLYRIGLAIILVIPALYTANESSRHRELERLHRKIHLELASIDSYLVLLPEPQRNEIKGKLTEKFFGVPLTSEKVEEISKKDLLGMVRTVVDNLTKGK